MKAVYVDLDNTLIDTLRIVSMQEAISAKHGLSVEDVRRAIDEVNKRVGIGKFSHKNVYDECLKFKADLAESIIGEWEDCWNDVVFFEDAVKFLKSFPKESLKLLTTGEPKRQNMKIKVHKMADYCSEILIVDTPKADYCPAPPFDAVYIDDSPREIEAMKKNYPYVYCIQVREVAPWETQKSTSFVNARCKNLREAGALINSL